MQFVLFIQCKNCMTTSESKGRYFFTKRIDFNRFASIRITNRIDSIRITIWNALMGSRHSTVAKSDFASEIFCFTFYWSILCRQVCLGPAQSLYLVTRPGNRLVQAQPKLTGKCCVGARISPPQQRCAIAKVGKSAAVNWLIFFATICAAFLQNQARDFVVLQH